MCEPSENCSGDVVEAFKLDEDFDYDNIILTPKYSVAEMAVLENLLQQGTTPIRVPYSAVGPQVSTCPCTCRFCGLTRKKLPEAPKMQKINAILYRSFISTFQANETSNEVKIC